MRTPYSDQYVLPSVRPSVRPNPLFGAYLFFPWPNLAQTNFTHKVPLDKVTLNYVSRFKIQVIAE